MHAAETTPGLNVAITTGGPRVWPALSRVYRESVISASRLLELIAPEAERRDRARAVLADHGGFLHEEPDWTARSFHNNPCLVAWGPAGILGFLTVVRHPPDVRAACARLYGWEEGRAYRTASSLPRRSATGALSWAHPDRALAVFSAIDRLAVCPDLCVRQRVGDQPLRNRGLGTALLRSAYATLPPDTWILSQIFEIGGVNGLPVDPPVVNLGSVRIHQKLGAERIGVLHERFQRQDGVTVDVAWGLWLLPVARLLETEGVGARQRRDSTAA
ncbi:MAG: hypothetical protein L0Z62_16535 [Gemmataceae bacterium]|nr:hypothetical protein [Gemmataceae bacterium]